MLIAIKKLADLGAVENGVLDVLFSRAVGAMVEDCRERPNVEKPREVTVRMRLVPVADKQSVGGLEEIRVEFELRNNLPVSRTRTLSMAASGGGLVYNDLSRDNVRQGTLPIDPPAGAGGG